jgi:hypothetical protein
MKSLLAFSSTLTYLSALVFCVKDQELRALFHFEWHSSYPMCSDIQKKMSKYNVCGKGCDVEYLFRLAPRKGLLW